MRRSLPRLTYGQLAATSLSSGDDFEFDTDVVILVEAYYPYD